MRAILNLCTCVCCAVVGNIENNKNLINDVTDLAFRSSSIFYPFNGKIALYVFQSESKRYSRISNHCPGW